MEENIMNDKKTFWLKKVIKKRPIAAFIVFLAVLFGLIFISSNIRSAKISTNQVTQVTTKKVVISAVDEVPRVSVQAKIDKRNIIQLVAQKTGVVSYLYAVDGQIVTRGKTIALISDTPFGGDASAVALEITEKQQKVSAENIERQEKIFKKQKEIIENTATATENSERQASIDKKQVSISEENAELSNELSQLNLRQAQLVASLATVKSPSQGIIQKILVRPGEFVTAGTPIALFQGEISDVLAEAQVSADIASRFAVTSSSYAQIGERQVEIKPVYISTEATNKYLYSIIFRIQAEYAFGLADASFVSLDIPLENKGEGNIFLVSLDAIQITQTKNFIFTFENGKAVSKEVQLGKVFGQFAEVVSGLEKTDKIIVNRNVFDGDVAEAIE